MQAECTPTDLAIDSEHLHTATHTLSDISKFSHLRCYYYAIIPPAPVRAGYQITSTTDSHIQPRNQPSV
jgi:hypothetical protein